MINQIIEIVKHSEFHLYVYKTTYFSLVLSFASTCMKKMELKPSGKKKNPEPGDNLQMGFKSIMLIDM